MRAVGAHYQRAYPHNGQRDGVHRHQCQIFSPHDPRDGGAGGKQKLVRFLAAFLNDAPHGKQRHHHEKDECGVVKHQAEIGVAGLQADGRKVQAYHYNDKRAQYPADHPGEGALQVFFVHGFHLRSSSPFSG